MKAERISDSINRLIGAGIDKDDARIEVLAFESAADTQEEFDSFVERRALLEPYAYILGTKPFYKSDFFVAPGVLIPRSDTEILVESALRYYGFVDFPMGDVLNVPTVEAPEKIRVVDLCTGTGCVGVSIADEIKSKGRSVTCTLADISDDAIRCATKNSEHNPDIDVIKLDVLDTDSVIRVFGRDSVNIVVSNPPYINSKDMEELDATVKNFEPELALRGGDDGLAFYGVLAAEALAVLKDDGALFVEHGYDQGEAVRALFDKAGLKDAVTLKDYGGNDRVTFGIKRTEV